MHEHSYVGMYMIIYSFMLFKQLIEISHIKLITFYKIIASFQYNVMQVYKILLCRFYPMHLH